MKQTANLKVFAIWLWIPDIFSSAAAPEKILEWQVEIIDESYNLAI